MPLTTISNLFSYLRKAKRSIWSTLCITKKYSVPLEPHCLPTHVVPVAQFAFSMQVDGWQIPPRQALFGGKQSVSAVHLRAAITNMCRYPNKWTRIPHLHISDKSFSILYSGCIQSLYSFVKKKKTFQQFYDNLWLGYYFLNSLFIIYCKWIYVSQTWDISSF